MESQKIGKIASWCSGKTVDPALLERKCVGISTDTRKISRGDIFVAIRGENHDGHRFAAEAVRKGAVAVVGEEIEAPFEKYLLRVKNSTRALGDIARGYRKLFSPCVIGVTGSDGKTTTKELLKKVLSSGHETAGTEGNLNNEIGLPLSIFRLDRKTEFFVLEMGMNRKGEIDYLSRIAMPGIGVITNIGTAHIGYFNSMKSIAESKAEMLGNLAGNGFAVLNYDNRFYEFLKGKSRRPSISFGMKRGADVRGIITGETNDTFSFAVEGEEGGFRMGFWNTTIMYPALVSCLAGRKFNVGGRKLREIIEDIRPLPGRGMIRKAGKLSIIDETYNCNPNSLRWALRTFSRKDFRGKIAVLGDMEELGRLSHVLHRNIGLYARNLDIDLILTFGRKSRVISETAGGSCRHFEDIEKLNRHLAGIVKGYEAVLVKVSRLMGLERTVDYLANGEGH